jgi:hypothetical protein
MEDGIVSFDMMTRLVGIVWYLKAHDRPTMNPFCQTIRRGVVCRGFTAPQKPTEANGDLGTASNGGKRTDMAQPNCKVET